MKLLLIVFAAATAAFAQTKSLACDGNNNRNDRRSESCEVREQTIAYGGRLSVDGGVNGGVSIKGWDNPSVLVRSKSRTYGELTKAPRNRLRLRSRELVGWDR